VTVLVAEEEVATELESRVPTAASPASAYADRSFVFPGRLAGLVVASDGTSFVSGATSRTIWRVDSGGNRTVAFAGAGVMSDATDTRPRVRSSAGFALAFDGNLVVADSTGHQVWALSPERASRLLAGSVSSYRGGPGSGALFRYPSDVAIGPDGTRYLADAGNHCIRTITSDGVVSTLAGSSMTTATARGQGPGARQPPPPALRARRRRNVLRRRHLEQCRSPYHPRRPGHDGGWVPDGIGVEVGQRWPTGVAVGHGGNLWIADHGNGAVRRIEQTGVSTTTLRLDDVPRPETCLTPAGVDR